MFETTSLLIALLQSPLTASSKAMRSLHLLSTNAADLSSLNKRRVRATNIPLARRAHLARLAAKAPRAALRCSLALHLSSL
jgi:hypothetical protein